MQLNIAYIDDEPGLCEMFLDLFSSDEIKITTFTEPVEFLAFLSRHSVDLIFLDYRLPHTTGNELALKINPTIPKVLMTGDISFATTYPFVKIFPKPFNEKEVLNLIQSYVALKQKNR